MTMFGTIFEVNNSNIGKLWDLLGHFDKKNKLINTVFYLTI